MKLVTIARGSMGAPGGMIGDDVLDFGLAASLVPAAGKVPALVSEILREDSGGLESARRTLDEVRSSDSLTSRLKANGALAAAGALTYLAPVPRPWNCFSHGQSYHSHVRDFDPNAPRVKPKHPPTGFIKTNAAITGPGTSITLPKGAPDMVDFEGEFCVVFGRECHNVSRDEAMNYIAGYTIINDVSGRNWVRFLRDPETSSMPTYHALNILYKQFPGFCPMGPNITTKDEIPDYHDLRLVTRLNGELMQDTLISELIWDIPELIEFYSKTLKFMPGDIMSTGTPGGVGAGRTPPVYMKAGDHIAVTVDGIGTLENTIVSA